MNEVAGRRRGGRRREEEERRRSRRKGRSLPLIPRENFPYAAAFSRSARSFLCLILAK